MTRPKILLLGCDGMVGWELQRSLATIGSLILHNRRSCDLSNLNGLQKIIEDTSPDIIINAAAYTAVDKAEEEHQLAYQVNSEAPRILANLAKNVMRS